ncbi:hypothetical protein QE152_g24675 [Popillia japonica]|uniref:Uncharacterized protein n=1 Tax=Popillia japonica TaxID=7064 RepID=A0AAW1K4X3_POPJA
MIRKTESLNRRHHACFKEMVTSLKEAADIRNHVNHVGVSNGIIYIAVLVNHIGYETRFRYIFKAAL